MSSQLAPFADKGGRGSFADILDGWPLRGGTTSNVLLLVSQLCVLLQISRSSSGRPEYAGSCSIPILVSANCSRDVDTFIQTKKGRIDN